MFQRNLLPLSSGLKVTRYVQVKAIYNMLLNQSSEESYINVHYL